MKCPHCDHIFKLTWKRYLSSTFGKHFCPKCREKSKLKGNRVEDVCIWFSVVALYTFILTTLYSELFSKNIIMAFSCITSILLFIPLDKFYDTTEKKTKKI